MEAEEAGSSGLAMLVSWPCISCKTSLPSVAKSNVAFLDTGGSSRLAVHTIVFSATPARKIPTAYPLPCWWNPKAYRPEGDSQDKLNSRKLPLASALKSGQVYASQVDSSQAKTNNSQHQVVTMGQHQITTHYHFPRHNHLGPLPPNLQPPPLYNHQQPSRHHLSSTSNIHSHRHSTTANKVAIVDCSPLTPTATPPPPKTTSVTPGSTTDPQPPSKI
ncbi:hypothetical protein RJ640_003770 [Escallonia rubra]|uniref:Uncharacterized protein n=1 Tax=Escallonia rubra TaxID=112253 RepID=A0AA88QUJ6_9ASTE|nr:hypothetical protein RJ640_003770 [Escallonia rubra]